MNEMNIQKRERRGSDVGSSGLGLGVPGSTAPTIARRKRLEFATELDGTRLRKMPS